MNVLDYAVNEARQEGKLEGEHQKALDIALQLKRIGLRLEDIITTTGLSKSEIEKL